MAAERFACTFGFVCLAAFSYGQAWEKEIAPGVLYRMEYHAGIPRTVHALRIAPSAELKMTPELAAPRMFEGGIFGGRRTVTEMLNRTSGIAAINGDFFASFSDPLGLMVQNGRILSCPFPNRSAFAWGDEHAVFGRFGMELELKVADGRRIAMDGVNLPLQGDRIVIFCQASGPVSVREGAIHVVVRAPNAQLSVGGSFDGTIERVVADGTTPWVGENRFVISATGARRNELMRLGPGEPVTIRTRIPAMEAFSLTNAIGGGPMLVRNSVNIVDGAAEKFTATFVNQRHPRTAIGRMASGHLWLLVIDGRQKMSAGATLSEVANIMLRLGCVDAMNLDGGGSATFSVFGKLANRPSDGSERRVVNSLVVSGPLFAQDWTPYTLKAPAKIPHNGSAQLAVNGEDGKAIPNEKVLWFMPFGPAWVDQGGTVRPLSSGKARVAAYVQGQILGADIEITPPPPPPRRRRR
ncbi:MAG: phosphodiester glycosidase family protein [Fimbriimonadaceae bacterium]